MYRATHTAIGKRVALKFLDHNAARDSDSVTRFQREAEAASAVESAHIVQIFDSGTGPGGRPYLVMELLNGEDLRARLRREGRVPLAEVVHIAGQVLRALGRAHAAGIVHRDLKPDNVFLCQRDDDPMFVKIVDFGISKVASRTATANTLTQRGTVLGTAFYMSPEQAQAFRDIDGRTDLYSLGTILYEALSGRPPHVGTVYEAVLIDICTKDAEDIRVHAPDVPQAVAEVVKKALARDRADRFQTAAEMYEALALAAPGLLRTGGPADGRGPLASFPERPSGGPSLPALTPASTATASGTAVHTTPPRRIQTLRTAVLVIVVALGAFAATVWLMPGKKSPAPDASGEPILGARGAPATASPSASAPQPEVAPATSRPDAAAAPSASAPAPPTVKTHPIKPTPKATAKPAGVASGLTLDTSGP